MSITGINGILEKALAGRWIAGEKIEDALETTERMNLRNTGSIINYLGESITDKKKSNEALEKYIELISAINKKKLKASIAVKPTQIGLSIDWKTASSNYSKIVSHARKKNVFVWMDMEESIYTERSIALYLNGVRNGNTGICIQSYLRRSLRDVRSLLEEGSTIRLVKGAYKEDSSSAFPTRAEATANFASIMSLLFKNSERFMVATHDKDLIEKAIKLSKKSEAEISFGMLNGIMNGYAYELAKNHDVYLYLPFGKEWVAYGYRRLKELRNSILIARSLFSKQ